MTFTIITVCYNAEKYIGTTIESVLGQTYDDYEYIIKDGGSSDTTLDIIRRYSQKHNIKVMNGNDSGIYNAMNQALAQANGQYVMFLNSGDSLYDRDVLKNIAEGLQSGNIDIAYGNMTLINRRLDKVQGEVDYASRKRMSRFYFLIGYTVCHQVVVAGRQLFEERQFDEALEYWADQDWLFYHISRRANIKPLPIMMVYYDCEGVSSDRNNLDKIHSESDMILRRYAPMEATILIPLKKIIRRAARAIHRIQFRRKRE